MEEYLSLTDLLDQNMSAYEYFQTLPPGLQTALRREDSVVSFAELQTRAEHMRAMGLPTSGVDAFQ